MSTRYEQIVAKFNRAKKHFAEFESRFDTFRKESPPEFRAEDYVETGERVYYLKSVPDIPPNLRAIAGDVLQSLRSSLDHLVWHLIEANGQTPTVGVSGFPIFDSRHQYEVGKGRKVEGMSEIAKQRIDSAYPYDGGNRPLWILNRLNNIDKHRLLLTMCVQPVAYAMPRSQREQIIAERRAQGLPVPSTLERGIVLTDPAKMVPLKAGEALVTVPAAHAHEDVGFKFEVAVNEPGVVEAMPFFFVYRFCESEVSILIHDLVPWLS